MLIESIKNTGRVLTHPIETLNELKHKRYYDWQFVSLVAILWFAVKILTRQLYGFRFNQYNPDDFSLFIQFFSTVIPFGLFCVTNWCVCSITDGEGKLSEIFTMTAISLIPYILFQAVAIVLSNMMTLEEGVFLYWFVTIGILWSAFLVFQSVRIVHQYSAGKALLTILITLVGIFLILFILLLLFTLVQQMYSFVSTIYSELMFRK